jgi:alpha-1,6-mannosyltransferase
MRRIGLDWQLLTLGTILFALTLWGAFAVDHFDDERIGYFLLVQAPFYALACWLVVTRPPATQKRALAAILLLALAMRLVLLPGTPVSTDVFRYIWDGRVQAAGVNPYLHLPTSETLQHLRDTAIYPFINRADYAPTIYPPTAQIVFFLITRISESVWFMKAAMVGFEALAVWAILQLLAARGLPATSVLLYAWHPLPLWEFARSGHLDAIAIAFLMLAFVAADRRSPLLAGVALAAGALVKYFPVVAGPALYRRWDWRLPVAFFLTVIVLYLPYLGAGSKLIGFLPQYVSEEGIEQGSGIFLWLALGAVVPLPAEAFSYYFPVAAAIMAALALAFVLRARRSGVDLFAAMVLGVVFTLLFSPHYPWYFVWLIPFICFHPSVAVIYLTCASGWLYFAHYPPTLADGLVIYGGFAVVLVAEFFIRRVRRKEVRHGDAVTA